MLGLFYTNRLKFRKDLLSPDLHRDSALWVTMLITQTY